MTAVEDEVVSMKFDNKQFEPAVEHTLSLLGKLKESLKFGGSQKGLSDVQNQANRFSTNRMQGAIQGVTHSWSAMRVVAGTVIATLTHQALIAGERLIGGFLSPIKNGFENYEQQINAVQTILANTKSAGTNLGDVTKALNQLNQYANLTIYNFSEMAKNIGTFTAAGVGLQQSVDAIKGIANLAALSGSNSQQASTAMYQLSQAIAAGQVHLQDWNSVVNAGMGGTVFQRALAQTAVAMGQLKDHSLKLVGPMKNVSIAGESFRQSLQTKPGQTSWLTSKVLTNTLAQFTGDLTKAQLKAQGFNAEQIKAIQAQAKVAENAATQIKTVSQLTQALKEEVASSWAQVFKTLLGNINQAKSILSPLHITIENMLRAPVDAFNRLLKGWAALGGRNIAIMAIKQGFHDLVRVIDTVKKAFHDVFPPETAQGLYGFTTQIETLMLKLKPSKAVLGELHSTFKGIFAIFDIGIQIVKGVVRGFEALFSSTSKGRGNFLKFTGNVGDMIFAFDQFLKKGDYIAKFFIGLAHIIAVPINILQTFAHLIASLFDGFSGSKVDDAGKSLDRLSGRLSPLQRLLQLIVLKFQQVEKAVGPLEKKLGDAFSGLIDAIASGLKSGDFSAVFDVINTALLGGIVLLIRRFFKKGLSVDVTGGLLKSIKEPFEQLTGNLKAMQTQVKAKTLLEIAGAVALLTASVVALSLINSKNLTKALTAMAAGFALLLGAMAILSKTSGLVKLPVLAASLVLLAGAINVLTLAIAFMGTLKWETIGRGLVGIAGALIVIAGAMRLMPKGMVLQAAAISILAVALTELSGVIAIMGHLKPETTAKGLLGIAGGLVVIAGAMRLMPKGMVLQAVALTLVGKALLFIAGTVIALGLLSWIQIAKGLAALAGSLAILAGGLYLMSGSLAGAAALAVAAGSLALLVPVLVALGHQSWGTIIKGLVSLAGIFTIIGLAGLVLSPIVPVILGLSVGVLAIGAGMALAGAGALAFATAFAVFITAVTAGTTVIGALIDLIPTFMTAFAVGILDFAKTIGKESKDLVNVGVKLILAILNGINRVIPKVGEVITTLIHTILKVLRNNIPDIVLSGLRITLAILQGLTKAMPRLTTAGANLLIAFMRGISKHFPDLADEAAKMIIKFIQAISKAIDNNSTELGKAGADMGISIAKGMIQGLGGMVSEVAHAAKDLAGHAVGAIHDLIHNPPFPSRVGIELGNSLGVGFAHGISASDTHVRRSASDIANTAVKAMQAGMKASLLAVDTIDTSPKITPVLDLSQVTKDAGQIGSLLGTHKLSTDVSRSAAQDISAEHAAKLSEKAQNPPKSDITINQTNNSPKALSPVDSYRNTKSAAAVVKEALRV